MENVQQRGSRRQVGNKDCLGGSTMVRRWLSPDRGAGGRTFVSKCSLLGFALLWGAAGYAPLHCIASVAAAAVESGTSVSTSATFDHHKLTSQVQAAIERAKPACVAVTELRRSGRGATFSAVIVSQDGYILTAAHCIKSETKYQVTLHNGRKLQAKGLGRSPHLDCGLLKIVNETDFPWAELGRSAELVLDQPCLSISHPGSFNAQRGLVVRFGRVLGTNSRGHIHNTCLMEPGDSGGGLFDLSGRVIGIHSYIAKSLEDNFDIPVDCFRDHWDQLCEAEEFDPPHAARNSGIVLQSNQTIEQGAEVADIVAESPAEEAGLQAGDVITAVNGTKLDSRFRVGRMLRRLLSRRDRDLNLTVIRQDNTHAVVIKKRVPPSYASVSYATDEFRYLSNMSEAFSAFEESLDDCTVRVASRQNSRTSRCWERC